MADNDKAVCPTCEGAYNIVILHKSSNPNHIEPWQASEILPCPDCEPEDSFSSFTWEDC